MSERTQERFVEALGTDLNWLGLAWDDSPVRQSARAPIYGEYFAQLERLGAVYPCFCTPLELDLARRSQLGSGRPPRYAGTCRQLPPAQIEQRRAEGRRASLRFRVPPGLLLEFDDLVHGPQRFVSDDIGDFVVRREDGSAAFFFSNAIDDALMRVTHVLRGEDHLSNTPRQRLLLRGARVAGAAVRSRVAADRRRRRAVVQAARRHQLRELREAGYAPEAVCNQLFRLGHSSARNELLDLAQMAQAFEPAHLQRSPAHFDPAHLAHWQREWVHGLSPQQADAWLAPVLPPDLDDAHRGAFMRAVLPNVVLPEDARLWQQIIFGEALSYEEPALRAAEEAGPEFFAAAADAVQAQPSLSALRGATGRKGAAFFMPLRAALTGRLHGPELAPLLAAMPAERVRARLLQFARAPS